MRNIINKKFEKELPSNYELVYSIDAKSKRIGVIFTIASLVILLVVMEKMGVIHIGKSRYQAEQALSYLKRNYPTYNNHHISGTGEWNDPYCVYMSKDIRTYDMRTKQEFICEADYN